MQQTQNEKQYDIRWSIALFGTAVGAGILFLPIRAGMSGFWPVLAMVILVFPMTWLSHRAVTRMVLANSKDENLMDTTETYFGKAAAQIISFLFFFILYPVCLIYAVGITNTVESFFINQLGVNGIPKIIYAFVFISIMMLAVISNRELMMKIMQALVYPLMIILMLFSLYLIPQWNLQLLAIVPSFKDFTISIWLTLPVLIFAFCHLAALSALAMDLKNKYRNTVDERATKITFKTTILLTIFTMFFVISVVLTLTPEQLLEARSQNISILSYIANIESSILISWAVPFVAFTAIFSSFLGHYLGAHEGLVSIIQKYTPQTLDENKINKLSALFIYITMIIVGYLDPSIVGVIEGLGGPIFAILLYLIPVYAVYNVPAMHKYKDKVADSFLLVMGSLAILSILYKMF